MSGDCIVDFYFIEVNISILIEDVEEEIGFVIVNMFEMELLEFFCFISCVISDVEN